MRPAIRAKSGLSESQRSLACNERRTNGHSAEGRVQLASDPDGHPL
jgi:hypothetical protein